jgi:hypothetical protein
VRADSRAAADDDYDRRIDRTPSEEDLTRVSELASEPVGRAAPANAADERSEESA